MTRGVVRVGLVGLGSMGRHHARIIRETDGMCLAAVADPAGDPFSVAGDLQVLPDVASLIESKIDAAVVAVPTVHHEAAALELAAAGIHTLVEKPIADSVAAGRRIAEAFEHANLIGAVGYVERCNAAIVQLKHRIREGQLGRIYQISTSRQSPFPSRISDVGVVQDLATHDLDLTAWIADSHYSSIHPELAYKAGRKHEDMLVASGRLANGIIVSHTVNWLAPFKDRKVTVIGERGALIADTTTADLTYYANASVDTAWESMAAFRGPSEGDVTRYAFAKPEPLMVEHNNFLRAIRGEEAEIVRMEEAVETLQVTERVLRCAAHG